MTNDELAAVQGIPTETIARLREQGITEETILAFSDEALRQTLVKLKKPDHRRRQLQHARLALLDDRGEIPADALSRSRGQLVEMRAGAPDWSRTAGVPVGAMVLPQRFTATGPVAGVPTDNSGWIALGPGNIGGRTRAIVIDPSNALRIFAGSADGGVWLSTDGGTSWQALEDLMANLAVCSLVMHPTNRQILYAGTGEGFSAGIRGDGIFRSTNGGWAWTQLSATQTPDFYYVNSLAISPDGNTLLAGTTTGIFRSTNSGWTWTKTTTRAASIGNVVFHPTDSTRAIAGGLGGHTYFTANGGVSWTMATPPAEGVSVNKRIQVAYAIQDPSIVYASVTAQPSQIWKSIDGGQTFIKQTANNNATPGQPANFLSQGGYANAIWAGDRTNSNRLVVGGMDLWMSTDGGTTLTQISNWKQAPPQVPSSAHADQHAIVADPGYNGTTNQQVYFGNDGGIYKTADLSTVGNNPPDYTNGWVNLDNGYAVTQFYYAAGNPATGVVVGGTQDNGTLRYTAAAGSAKWNTFFGGDGGAVAADPSNPDKYYGEYINLQIFRNTNGAASIGGTEPIYGQFWNGTAWVWKADGFCILDAKREKANFIAPFVLDPNNSNRILGGGLKLWRTNDAQCPNTPTSGPRWASIKERITGSDVDAKYYISAIAVGPGNSDLILVGHNNGQVYKTTNGTSVTPTWTRIDNAGATPINATRTCLSVTIDPRNNSVCYATFAGYQSGNVWKSTDGGATWTDISGRLPQAPIRDLAVHPQNSNWLYAATDVGLFASEDGGQSWSPTNEGPANVVIADLAWMGNVLIAATHGRGIFALTIPQTAQSVLVGDQNGKLYAVNPQSGTASITVVPASPVRGNPLVARGTVWLGSQGGGALALNAATLALMWRQPHSATSAFAIPQPQLYQPPGGGDPQLLTAADDGLLYFYNANNGTPLGSVNVAHSVFGAVPISNLVMADWAYLGTSIGVHAVNLITRTVAWQDTTFRSLTTLLLASNRVFAPVRAVNGPPGARCNAYDARTGNQLWSTEIGTNVVTAAQPAWLLGAVVIANTANQVLFLDYRTGNPVFTLSLGTDPNAQAVSLTAAGNKLYVVVNTNQPVLKAYTVTPAALGNWSVTLLWSKDLTGPVFNPGLVVDGSLYLNVVKTNTQPATGQLVAYSTTDGSLRWTFPMGEPATASPAAVFPTGPGLFPFPRAIKIAGRYFFTAANNGGMGAGEAVPIRTNAQAVGPNEKFKLIRVASSTDQYALKTPDGLHYVTAVNNGGLGGPNDAAPPIHTGTTVQGPWETFMFEGQTDGSYAIRTSAGFYFSAVGGGGQGGANTMPIHTNATVVGPWETFTLI